jgi:hypothetical protein
VVDKEGFISQFEFVIVEWPGGENRGCERGPEPAEFPDGDFAFLWFHFYGWGVSPSGRQGGSPDPSRLVGIDPAATDPQSVRGTKRAEWREALKLLIVGPTEGGGRDDMPGPLTDTLHIHLGANEVETPTATGGR